MDKLLPLVSVPVITYNSSKSILETLESIKYQTYTAIELIISDDSSDDDTVELCQRWIINNRQRFKNVKLLTTSVNSGISVNLNRAEKECSGDFVKCIAGDDLLAPECIETFVNFAIEHPNNYFFFSQITAITEDSEQKRFFEQTFVERNRIMDNCDSEGQLQYVLNGVTPPAPSFFYSKAEYDRLGIRNDERIKMIEDYPKWIMLLKKGARFSFVHIPLVYYRLGGISTSKKWISPEISADKRRVELLYLFTEKYKRDSSSALEEVLSFELQLLQKADELSRIRQSLFYRIGHKLHLI